MCVWIGGFWDFEATRRTVAVSEFQRIGLFCLLFCWFRQSNKYPAPLSAVPTNQLQFQPPIRAAALCDSLSGPEKNDYRAAVFRLTQRRQTANGTRKIWFLFSFYFFISTHSCWALNGVIERILLNKMFKRGKRRRPLTRTKKNNWILTLESVGNESATGHSTVVHCHKRNWTELTFYIFFFKRFKPVKVNWVIYLILNRLRCCLKAPVSSLPRHHFMQKGGN